MPSRPTRPDPRGNVDTGCTWSMAALHVAELFVYYRVAEPALATTVAAVRRMQATLASTHPGLQTGLLRRPEAQDGEVTLMETYAGATTPDLAHTLTQAAAGLPQPRHLEWFEPLN